MAEPSELPFGHFGQPTYDPITKEWTFQRTLRPPRLFRVIGDARRLIADPTDTSESSADEDEVIPVTEKPWQRYPKEISELIQEFPELQPASSILTPLMRVSEAVEKAVAVHDSIHGDLLATGRISSLQTHHMIRVVATASGISGSNLSLIMLQRMREGWADTRTSYLRSTSPAGEFVTWRGPGAPIQQVVFSSQEKGRSAFLAIRLSVTIYVFRPLVRRQQTDCLIPCGLDTNLILTIHSDRTGNCQLQDLQFNPFFIYQFGTVNQYGVWTIFEISVQTRSGSKTYTAKVVCSNKNTFKDESGEVIYDGWMRMDWVCDPDTVVVSSRRKIDFYDISTKDASRLQTLEFESFVSDHTLLTDTFDVLVVLTTSHVIIYRVRRTNGQFTADVLLKIRHFRNSNDTTLRIHQFADDEDIVISVRSDLNSVVEMYRVARDREQYILCTDPVSLPIPTGLGALSTFIMHPLDCHISVRRPSMAKSYHDRGIRFYSALVLDRNLTVYRLLYAGGSALSLQDVKEPSWLSRMSSAAKAPPSKGFIVEDEDEDEDSNWMRSGIGRHSLKQGLGSRGKTRKAERWVSLENIVKSLCYPGLDSKLDVDVISQRVKDIIAQGASDSFRPMRTISEFVGNQVAVYDIDTVSNRLDNLNLMESEDLPLPRFPDDPTEQNRKLTVRQVKLPLLNDLEPLNKDLDMSTVYERMVSEWITPLPQQIHSRARVAMEQRIRRAAADLVLSTKVITVQSPQDTIPTEIGDDIRSKFAASPSHSLGELPIQSSQLPTLSNRSTPSFHFDRSSRATTPSLSFVTASTTFSTAPELANLSKYMTLTVPSATHSAINPITNTLPRGLHSVLAQWRVGEDPKDYNWASSARRVEKEQQAADMESQDLSERDREKFRRRAERHLRRQRREAEARERTAMQSSQVLEIATNASRSARQTPALSIPASSPIRRTFDLRPRGVAESQFSDAIDMPGSSQSQTMPVVSSQQVPGRFGSRPTLGQTNKKRKRKSGF